MIFLCKRVIFWIPAVDFQDRRCFAVTMWVESCFGKEIHGTDRDEAHQRTQITLCKKKSERTLRRPVLFCCNCILLSSMISWKKTKSLEN